VALKPAPEFTPGTTPATKEPRILELDGIRGVAVLAVVFYHYAVIGPGAPFHTLLYWGRAVPRLGWSGVDLFFVLSGFLIGGILLDSRNSPRYFKTFYARRSYRILPLYFLWLALYPLAVAADPRWGIPALAQSPRPYFRWSLHWVFLQAFSPIPWLGSRGSFLRGRCCSGVTPTNAEFSVEI
jgi:peptidoglycan/LPS O-acetylase OafA/YrhL